ncbi:hypothetical protein CGCF413_v012216 [Colletotrichum fructicola]|nr:hypothetical protein CGCF413_v012216 [Colletotrichum fructicola]
MSCVPPEDMIGPASMERQTKLAHLKLVSKYYGYANFSYPRPDGTPSRNPYRRAGQTYSSEDLSQEEYDEPSCPQTPTRRDRSSIGSQSSDGSSAPSLIDDRTDSEVSLDDDYQYHASASQLWDSFWPAEEDPSRKTPETSKTQYPALIPSPHIRRAKKTGCINYEDYPLPPRPVEYNIKVNNPATPPKDNLMTSPQPRPTMPSPRAHDVSLASPYSPPEPRRTIRAVRSSYSLFPRTQPPPSYPPPPPPRLAQPPSLSNLRKGTRPPPIHLHSLPAPTVAPMHSPATASLYSPLYSPLCSPVPSFTRPHTSHGTYPADTLSPTDLSHPRSAPLPPPIQVHNTTSAPKSFFDFDSDSDSDDPEPEHTISRFVKTLHKRTASEARRSTKGAAFADAQLRRARADTAETIREPEGQQLFIERHKRGFGRMFRGRSHGN